VISIAHLTYRTSLYASMHGTFFPKKTMI